jgi:hypothetical protein
VRRSKTRKASERRAKRLKPEDEALSPALRYPRDTAADRVARGGSRRWIGPPDEDLEGSHHRPGFVLERGISPRIGQRMDPPPDRELRGRLRLLSVPPGELPESARVVVPARVHLEIGLRIGSAAKRPPRLGPTEESRPKRRQARERDLVDALGFAGVTSPEAEGSEAEIRVTKHRVERDGLRVAANRDEVVLPRFMLARFAQELDGRGRGLPRSRSPGRRLVASSRAVGSEGGGREGGDERERHNVRDGAGGCGAQPDSSEPAAQSSRLGRVVAARRSHLGSLARQVAAHFHVDKLVVQRPLRNREVLPVDAGSDPKRARDDRLGQPGAPRS